MNNYLIMMPMNVGDMQIINLNTKDTWNIGRYVKGYRGNDKLDIAFKNPMISKLHGIFARKKDNYCYADNDSTNGSFLNGQLLPKNISHELKYGDSIIVGGKPQTILNNEKYLPALFLKSNAVWFFYSDNPQDAKWRNVCLGLPRFSPETTDNLTIIDGNKELSFDKEFENIPFGTVKRFETGAIVRLYDDIFISGDIQLKDSEMGILHGTSQNYNMNICDNAAFQDYISV